MPEFKQGDKVKVEWKGVAEYYGISMSFPGSVLVVADGVTLRVPPSALTLVEDLREGDLVVDYEDGAFVRKDEGWRHAHISDGGAFTDRWASRPFKLHIRDGKVIGGTLA